MSKLSVTLIPLCLLLLPCAFAAWGFGSDGHDKVRLQDIQVLTLYADRMTTGRRSSPVPQLNCVGGSAAGKFKPQVVQCYNRGWDGQDVQWECKSDMDNAFRFGRVEVVCEGYDYPDDPYILKGSCGLEYTLDYTMEGNERQKRQDNHNYGYGDDGSYYGSSSNSYYGNSGGYGSSYNKNKSSIGDYVVLAVLGLVVYALYKTCISSGREMGDNQYSSTNDDYPSNNPGGGGGGWFNPGTGGGQNQYHGGGYANDAHCGRGTGQRGTGGGFWTGAMTGGLLGYMFGNRRGYGGYGTGYGTGWGTGYGTGYRARPTGGFGGWGGGGGGFSSSSSSSSSGTRTASGFGGTRRR